MKHYLISAIALLSLTFTSCENDENEDTLSELTEYLPSPENVKSTSAYIPFNATYDEGNVELCWSTYDDFGPYNDGFDRELPPSLYLEKGANGFLITGLEPDCTYYYTIIYHKGEKRIYSKQVKSFTTKSVSIKFTEATVISRNEVVLYVKTFGVEEYDVPYNLHVTFYSIYNNGSKSLGHQGSGATKYLGDGIWQHTFYVIPSTEECWQATIETQGDGLYNTRVVAKTPVVTLEDGVLVEKDWNPVH